jgi:hypothetical protein
LFFYVLFNLEKLINPDTGVGAAIAAGIQEEKGFF